MINPRSRLVACLTAAVLVLAGCDDLEAMLTLSSAVQRHYGVQPVVKVTNEAHLTITFDLAFAHVRSLGPLTITHTDAPFTFAMRDIPSPLPSSAPAAAR